MTIFFEKTIKIGIHYCKFILDHDFCEKIGGYMVISSFFKSILQEYIFLVLKVPHHFIDFSENMMMRVK